MFLFYRAPVAGGHIRFKNLFLRICFAIHYKQEYHRIIQKKLVYFMTDGKKVKIVGGSCPEKGQDRVKLMEG